MDPALHALNRFGLGARIGERRAVSDPREWLLTQLNDASSSEREPVTTTHEVADALHAVRSVNRRSDPDAARRARRHLVALTAAEMVDVMTKRVNTDAPFTERLVAFWANHLCVSARAKATVAPLAGVYEREVIRRHVLGRFEDMVIASASHPAMLLYLDNAQSIGPSSRAATAGRRARAATRGLNENYARELLELHTLGVDGGYTQSDVQELARILTGWTIAGLPGGRGAAAGGALRFIFDPLRHDPGLKTVLGVRFREADEEEGRNAIRMLCRHPATARHIAAKLVRHFVADDPPANAVDAVARAFAESQGDLRVTAEAIVALRAAWSDDARKFRSPQDWLTAVLRALNADGAADNVPLLLRQLRHPVWGPIAPNGFGDTMRDWADPDALLNRAELARSLSRRLPRQVDPHSLLEVLSDEGTSALRGMVADAAVPNQERVALVIASPAFQWR